MIKGLITVLVLFCCMGAGPCWTKHQYVHTSPVVVGTRISVPLIQPPTPYVVYQPVVVMQTRLVTVVENNVTYVPLGYTFYPVINYGYEYQPWVGYNY
jgi:hypothetical protein